MMMGRPRSRPGWRRRRSTPSTGTARLQHAGRQPDRALVASGEWDKADRVSAAAVRAITANYPHMRLIVRRRLETGRGDFDAARAHLDAARATLHSDRDLATYDAFIAELASVEHCWTDAETAVRDGVARTYSGDMAQIRPGCAPRGCAPWPSWRRSPAPAGTATPSALARSCVDGARHGARRRSGGRVGHAQRRRLASARRGRVPAEPAARLDRSMVGGGGDLGTAGAPAAGGLLPLAPGRGAGRRRRLPRRGQRAAPAGPRRRGPDRSGTPGRTA